MSPNKKKQILLDKLKRITWILITFILFFDTVNGFLLKIAGSEFSISQPIKITLLLLLLIQLNKKAFLLSIISILIPIFLVIIHIPSYKDLNLLDKEIEWGFKIILIIVSFLFFSQSFRRNNHETLKEIIKFTKVSIAIIFINLVLSLFGIGDNQYQGKIGGLGFIYAGNELSLVIVICSLILASYYLNIDKIKQFLLSNLILFIIATIKINKVAILGTLATFWAIPTVYISDQINSFLINRKKIYFYSFFILFLTLSASIILYVSLYYLGLSDRLSSVYKESDLISTIFSHRNVHGVKALDYFINHYEVVDQIFGKGFLIIYSNTLTGSEIDFIDFLMVYGLFGTFLIYAFFIFRFLKNLYNFFNFKLPFSKYLSFGVPLLLIISMTAGHTFNSGIGAIFIGAFLSLENYGIDS